MRGKLEYTYTVNNGDTATAMVGTFTVEGNMHIYQDSVCHVYHTNPVVPITLCPHLTTPLVNLYP